ncbi:MAG: hypothetical protein WD872_19715 [Pirellulaceae bacterium]
MFCPSAAQKLSQGVVYRGLVGERRGHVVRQPHDPETFLVRRRVLAADDAA